MNYFNYVVYEVLKKLNANFEEENNVLELINTYFGNCGISYEDINIVHNAYDVYQKYYDTEKTVKIINALLNIFNQLNIDISDISLKQIISNNIKSISNYYSIPLQNFKIHLNDYVDEDISLITITITINNIDINKENIYKDILSEFYDNFLEDFNYDPFATFISESIYIDNTNNSANLIIKYNNN